MSMVSVDGLGKRYQLHHRAGGAEPYRTLRDTLAGAASAPFRWWNGTMAGGTSDEFWALRDISFEISSGEVLGIIGRNGAGKSTLLKILSRITEPTLGRVALGGRVASLLEVGTGFHPELTGRENIFLNGAILGMTHREIRRKFDSIVSFAGVERFLDTPVKRYSSGMYVRLAFAVAAHLEPDILVIDEVLAVGDAEFQRKSLGKMHEVGRGGRTVLFVSHNMAAVQSLCTRALWLERGTVAFAGAVDDCITHYLSHTATGFQTGGAYQMALGPTLELRALEMTPNPVEVGGRVDFVVTFHATDATRVDYAALLIYTLQEIRVAIVDLRRAGMPRMLDAGETWTLRGWINRFPLVEGDYRIGLGIGTSDFFGDKLGLIDLRVAPKPDNSGLVPYAAAHRGVVELEFGLTP